MAAQSTTELRSSVTDFLHKGYCRMTVEQRFILDLSEVVAIRVECSQCGAAVVVQPLVWRESPPSCPACHGLWEFAQPTAHGFTSLQHFATGLRQLIEQAKAAAKTDRVLPYRVLVEMRDVTIAKYQ
jgi:hypothetical protein